MKFIRLSNVVLLFSVFSISVGASDRRLGSGSVIRMNSVLHPSAIGVLHSNPHSIHPSVSTSASASRPSTSPSSPSYMTPGPGGYGWDHQDGNLDWIGRNVSISSVESSPNDPITIFSHFDFLNTRSGLFHVRPHASSPVIQETDENPDQPQSVHSARDADVHVAMTETGDSVVRVVKMKKYSRRSGLIDTYVYPHLTNWGEYPSNSHVRVSDDGKTIVATARNPQTFSTEILVFRSISPEGPFPPPQIYSISDVLEPTVYSMDMSGDASTMVLGKGYEYIIFDLVLGQIATRFFAGAWIANMGVAISGDGRTFAYGNYDGQVTVMEKRSGVYSRTAIHQTGMTAPLSFVQEIAVSGDGKTIAYAVNRSWPQRNFLVGCIQKKSPRFGNLWGGGFEEILASPLGPNGVQNVVMDIDLTTDGSIFAVASMGDEESVGSPIAIEEVRAYRCRKGERGPFHTVDLPGSAFAVSLSKDGRWLSAASKSVHANILGRGGSLIARALFPFFNE